jgi:hypothetical protein
MRAFPIVQFHSPIWDLIVQLQTLIGQLQAHHSTCGWTMGSETAAIVPVVRL